MFFCFFFLHCICKKKELKKTNQKKKICKNRKKKKKIALMIFITFIRSCCVLVGLVFTAASNELPINSLFALVLIVSCFLLLLFPLLPPMDVRNKFSGLRKHSIRHVRFLGIWSSSSSSSSAIFFPCSLNKKQKTTPHANTSRLYDGWKVKENVKTLIKINKTLHHVSVKLGTNRGRCRHSPQTLGLKVGARSAHLK